MCGRFVQFWFDEFFLDIMGIAEPPPGFTPNYNVAPTQRAWVVLDDGQRRLEAFHWGLVPFWAKDTKGGSRLINARSESAGEKPSFRAAFKARRCIVLSNGFYEWTGQKGDKQPHLCTVDPESMMAFAGLWETWQAPEVGDSKKAPLPYYSFTILTRDASPSFQAIHHRMPVILDPKAFDQWLAPNNQDPSMVQEILERHHIGKIITHPVTQKINSPRYNEPDSITPLESVKNSPPVQYSLF